MAEETKEQKKIRKLANCLIKDFHYNPDKWSVEEAKYLGWIATKIEDKDTIVVEVYYGDKTSRWAYIKITRAFDEIVFGLPNKKTIKKMYSNVLKLKKNKEVKCLNDILHEFKGGQ